MASRIPEVTAQVYTCPIGIGGSWQPSRGRVETLRNPATGEPITQVPYCTAEEVRAAIEAADAAFPAWRGLPVQERVRTLFRFRQLLEDHLKELAGLVTTEQGKTLEEAQGSVRRGIEAVEFACGIPTLLMGESLENVGTRVDCVSIRQPLGVCAGIPPSNFPAMVPLWMFPLAIACGNTFVLKPSDKVPRTCVRLVELLYEAGLPAGVVNVVHGAKEVADILLADPRVRAVSFVGSAAVAKYIYQTAATNGKRVQALGGAKNHLVVMPDADLKATAKAILGGAFGCAGERCLATSVVVAVGDAAEPLLRALVQAADALKVGAGSDPQTEMGPVLSAAHRERILQYIELGQQEGATLVRDGRAVKPHDGSTGYYVGPTIFDRVRPEMRIAREEIFGPVLAVIRSKDMDEAIATVNRSSYGNAAAIFTQAGWAGREFASRVEAGMVGINVSVPAPSAFFPFAGWKGSFYGDLHAHGKDAIEFYTEKKVVTSRWSTY
ncbi:MAG TPA: CoA-acylating methylmalonate-semialdehyde dehydrogenase [Candidatus Acidoferrales bacterium]|nr:CoA-acylating methylmalonate-semialdehyde dehydrogenase [Candidatus Acidoferrales bacterium]